MIPANPAPSKEQGQEEMDSHERRLLRAEFKLEQHDHQLGILHADFKAMNEILESIQKVLSKIQWLVTGAILLGLAQYFGVAEIIKGLMRL